MSVLIYPDSKTAGNVAATLLAASMIENPYETIGLTYDSVLDGTFEKLSEMVRSGLFAMQQTRLYQLCEFVPTTEQSVSIRGLLKDAFLDAAKVRDEQYVIPYAADRNWAQICSDFENDILEHGGLDVILLALRPDGSLLYNLAGSELAPVTHVEPIGTDKVVSAGMATVMRAKKLIVVAAGTDCADAAVRTLGGEISNAVPASYLQLHQNVTFILDEEAASLL